MFWGGIDWDLISITLIKLGSFAYSNLTIKGKLGSQFYISLHSNAFSAVENDNLYKIGPIKSLNEIIDDKTYYYVLKMKIADKCDLGLYYDYSK